MIFPKLSYESTLQVDDKTRLYAGNSYVSKDEADITVVEIEPEAGAGYISVFATSARDWYLDYEYATDGDKVVSVRVDNGSTPITASFTITVVTLASDSLWSTDQDLTSIKTSIKKWLPKGKSSFIYAHRRAQKRILALFDEKGITDSDGAKLTKAAFVDSSEANEASTFLTLHYIYADMSDSTEDIQGVLAVDFFNKFEAVFQRPWRLDLDGDSVIDLGEGIRPFQTVSLYRKR